MGARHRRWLAERGPIPGGLKQLQPHGKGIVWKGLAINDMRARVEMAGEGSNGNILIERPGAFRQNADAVKTDVNCGSDLARGTLETVELDQHLFGDAAFGPDRREYVRHGCFLRLDSAGLSCRTGGGFSKVVRGQVPL